MTWVTVTEILQGTDPFPDGTYPRPVPEDTGCWGWEGEWATTYANHSWQPASIGEESSTWYCRLCRSVERRRLIET